MRVSEPAGLVVFTLPPVGVKTNLLPPDIVAAVLPVNFNWLVMASGPAAVTTAVPGLLKSARADRHAAGQVHRAAGDGQSGHRVAGIVDVHQAAGNGRSAERYRRSDRDVRGARDVGRGHRL